MSAVLAWRILMHEKARNALAAGGISIAILMIFLQLGFYASVPRAGLLIYDHLRFDILLTSSSYVNMGQSYLFPRRRIYQALDVPEVATAVPFYEGEAYWLSRENGTLREIFVMGVDPGTDSFTVSDVERQSPRLRQPDTLLIDTASLPMYGPQVAGRTVELDGRAVTIAGRYDLGTGVIGLGAVVMSDLNFIRVFPARPLATVSLGLVRLKPGSDPDRVAAELRSILPADTSVFTRAEIEAHETDFWRHRTSTGLIFGSGVAVSVIVGIVILYQILTTQVVRQLPQYATLKAMGYGNGHLQAVVAFLALVTAAVAFPPALLGAVFAYEKLRTLSRLPIEMTPMRILLVLGIAVAMTLGTSLLAARKLRHADPADLF